MDMMPDVREALRYLGVQDPPAELVQQAQAVAGRLSAAVQPKYTYRVYGLDALDDGILLHGSGVKLTGLTAKQMLAQCGQAALLACTLGSRFDALLLSLQARDMAKAVICDALGSALVEAGCAAAEREIAARFPEMYLTDRFSPGYGDLPLELQRSLCDVLEVQRRLGVTVTPSLLMNPMKSVTAVIGLSERPQPARIRGCGFCSMYDRCTFRKGGKRCAP